MDVMPCATIWDNDVLGVYHGMNASHHCRFGTGVKMDVMPCAVVWDNNNIGYHHVMNASHHCRFVGKQAGGEGAEICESDDMHLVDDLQIAGGSA